VQIAQLHRKQEMSKKKVEMSQKKYARLAYFYFVFFRICLCFPYTL
jgi:hypothetical protein